MSSWKQSKELKQFRHLILTIFIFCFELNCNWKQFLQTIALIFNKNCHLLKISSTIEPCELILAFMLNYRHLKRHIPTVDINSKFRCCTQVSFEVQNFGFGALIFVILFALINSGKYTPFHFRGHPDHRRGWCRAVSGVICPMAELHVWAARTPW